MDITFMYSNLSPGVTRTLKILPLLGILNNFKISAFQTTTFILHELNIHATIQHIYSSLKNGFASVLITSAYEFATKNAKIDVRNPSFSIQMNFFLKRVH